MNKIRTGFKVVRRMDYFRVASAFNFGKRVDYNINIWTKRPLYGYGPLSVFKRLKDAENFIRAEGVSGFEIYLCEYDESSELKLYSPTNTWTKSWCPEGTDFAERIKLIQQMTKS